MLCEKCSREIIVYSPHCIYCQGAANCGISHESCALNSRYFTFSIVLFHYTKTIKRIFGVFKYDGAYKYAKIIEILLHNYAEIDPFLLFRRWIYGKKSIVLIPVPMHPEKLSKRGFSPAVYICHYLARICLRASVSVYIDEKSCRKLKMTIPQAKLKKVDRLRNQRDVFSFDHEEFSGVLLKYAPDLILIVDDVLSTGATVNSLREAMGAIKNEEHIECGLFAIARG